MIAPFYVYILAYPDGSPFYVGKGKGTRISDHGTTRGRLASVNAVLAEIGAAGSVCLRSILHSGLTENEAFELERVEIARVGRRPAGPLVNSNDGGWGGRNPSAATREKIRQARLRQAPPSREHMVAMNRKRGPWTDDQKQRVREANTGRPFTEEHCRRLSERPTEALYRPKPGDRSMANLYRGSPSDETKAKLAKANRERIWTPEQRAAAGTRTAGSTQSEASNAKRSATLKGKPKSPEHLAAIAAAKARSRAAREAGI